MSTARLLSNTATDFTTTPASTVSTSATSAPSAAILSVRSEAKFRLIAELTSYGKRAPNWDGEGAEAPLAGDVAGALKFLETYPAGFQLPRTMLYSAGDVALYWEKGDGYADLEFYMGEASLYTNSAASMYNEDELIAALVVEELTPSWVEAELGFFKD